MINTRKLFGVMRFIAGVSRGTRGIGKKAAKDIVIAAEPQPKLSGTIYTACGIDIANCSAMNSANARGTFSRSKVCLHYLLNSASRYNVRFYSKDVKSKTENVSVPLSVYTYEMGVRHNRIGVLETQLKPLQRLKWLEIIRAEMKSFEKEHSTGFAPTNIPWGKLSIDECHRMLRSQTWKYITEKQPVTPGIRDFIDELNKEEIPIADVPDYMPRAFDHISEEVKTQAYSYLGGSKLIINPVKDSKINATLRAFIRRLDIDFVDDV